MPAESVFPVRRVLALAAVATAVGIACAGPGTNPNLVDVSGHWRYTERYTDAAHQTSCSDSGGYDLVQSQDGFVGVYGQRGLCTTPQGAVDNTDSGSVTEGHVVGRTIRFKAPNCDYDGQTPVGSSDRLDGNVYCSAGDSHITYTFTGTWSAVR